MTMENTVSIQVKHPIGELHKELDTLRLKYQKDWDYRAIPEGYELKFYKPIHASLWRIAVGYKYA